MIVHQFEACSEEVQELLRARSVETGVAEGLNALQLLGDAAFPCLRVSHRDCKVAVYHTNRSEARLRDEARGCCQRLVAEAWHGEKDFQTVNPSRRVSGCFNNACTTSGIPSPAGNSQN